MLRIALADDSVLLREGIAALLTRVGHQVVTAVGDAAALAAAVAQDRPDIVVTDVRMPPTFTDEGLHAAVGLRRRHPGLPVLVLSQYIATAYAAKLLESSDTGAVGYLLKDRVGEVAEFVDAIEQVAAGGCVIDPHVISQLFALRHDPLTRLTPREREVLALMAEGRSNTAITKALTVTEKAVSKYIGAIFTKLDLPVENDDHHRRVRAVLTYLHS